MKDINPDSVDIRNALDAVLSPAIEPCWSSGCSAGDGPKSLKSLLLLLSLLSCGVFAIDVGADLVLPHRGAEIGVLAVDVGADLVLPHRGAEVGVLAIDVGADLGLPHRGAEVGILAIDVGADLVLPH